MDYERKYKEALANARQEYNTTENVERKQWLVELFPELTESEDEKVRKTLIRVLNENIGNGIEKYGAKLEDALAWLEKQKSVGEIVARCKKSWYNEGKIQGQIEGLSDEEKYQQGWHDALEKQGEKTPVVDFRAEDWYVSKVDGKIHNAKFMENPSCISSEKQGEQKPIIEMKSPEESLGISSKEYSEIVNDCLDYSSIDPHFFKTTDKVEPKFKVGDWITNGHCKCQITFIDSRYWYSETCVLGNVIDIDKTFHLWTIQDAKDGDVIVYRNTATEIIMLFKSWVVDREAAYTHFHIFDNSYRVNNSCDCGNGAHPATKEQRDILFSKMKEAGYVWDAEKKELKKIHIIDEGKAEMDYCFTKMMNGEKVSPAWSEEDENVLEDIEEAIINYWHGDTQDILLDWLKSLKGRYTWKPNDEQMMALEYIINNAHNTSHSCKIAKELLEQLKKLK